MSWRTPDEVDSGMFLLRLLMVGYAKVGKTTAAIVSSPGPVGVLNFDDDSGLREPRRQCDERAAKAVAEGKLKPAPHFMVKSLRGGGYKKCLVELPEVKADAEAGRIKTVVIDNLTMLSTNIMAECLRETMTRMNNEDPRRAHQLYTRRILQIVSMFLEIKAHVIVLSHCPPPWVPEPENEDDKKKVTVAPGLEEGLVIPLLENKTVRARMPALFTDIIFMGYDTRTTKRYFLTGPRGAITGPGCRSLKSTVTMISNITVLLRAFRGENIDKYLIK